MRYRCSRLGDIMTGSRDKSDPLGETCKAYLDEIIIFKKYGIKKNIESKYLEKGILMEMDSIGLLLSVDNIIYSKNEERFDNGVLTGEPDIIHEDKIIDIKSSWDLFSHLKNKKINPKYEWQVLGYMELTGLRKAEVIHVLVDTPDTMIEDEIRRLSWKLGMLEVPEEIQEEIRNNMIFKQVPINERVIRFEVQYSQEKIDQLYNKLELCNQYIFNQLNK
jgi:hypothetical protein